MPKTTLLRKQVTPTGAIEQLAGDTVPSGYLFCDGSIVNIADYPRLYTVIGTAHGYGNNDGLTFHLPDLRGRFLRGTDEGAGRDGDAGVRTPGNLGGNSGDAVGTVQNDDIGSHTHTYRRSPNQNADYDGVAGSDRELGNKGEITGTSDPAGGADTRPINLYVKYIIKAV